MIRPSRSVPIVVLILALVVTLGACSRDKAESKAPPATPAVPVAVAPVEQKAMPLQIQAIGTVEALSVVSVRAQVGGELMRVHFQEGQDVKKGDLLFTIDPRSFEAAVAQAQANLARDTGLVQQARAALERDRARVLQTRAALARDQAQARTADAEAKRYAELYKRELISLEQSEQFHTTAEALAATVRADEADVKSAEETVKADEAAIKAAEQTVRGDEAMVETAKIQLGYTKITSPVDGRTGSLMLHEGNIVRAGGTSDSTLVVINQIQPVYVSFTVPQQQLPAIRRYMAAGTLEVRATPAGDAQPQRGTVSFVDNIVDAATGTIRLKGTFTNAERKLWPGQFANVELVLSTEPDAIVVPAQAVQTGQGNSTFVFVVKDDSTVETRRITVKRTQGNETVVGDGLKPGEKVVTDGMPRLVAGAKVEIRAPGQEGGRSGGGRRSGGAAPGGAAPGGPAPDAAGKAPGKAQP